MKKVAILLLSILLLAGAGGSVRAAGADIIVLMDASGTILPWYDQINGRILADITKKFVRTGDTFHLISFNSRSNLEIVQPVQGESDVSRIVSRFMLLYPIGQNSDFLSGLQYTWQYVSTLDQLREKIVIVISDGIFNPPSASQYSGYSNEQVARELETYARKIRGAGWSVYYIKLPFPENATITALDGSTVSIPGDAAGTGGTEPAGGAGLTTEAGSDAGAAGSASSEKPAGGNSTTGTAASGSATEYTDVSGTFTDAVGVDPTKLPDGDIPIDFIDSVFDLPEVTFPASIGKTGRTFILPLTLRNKGNNEVNLELTGVTLGAAEVLQKHAFVNLGKFGKSTLRAEIKLPDSIEKGEQALRFSLHFAGNARVHPQEGTVSMIVTGFSPLLAFRQGGSLVFGVLLVVLGAAFVLLIILLVLRHTSAPAQRALHAAKTEETRSESAIGLRKKEEEKRSDIPAATASTAVSASFAEASKKDKTIYRAETAADKRISADMAASNWGGPEILKAEKQVKTIDFEQKKDKTISFTAARDADRVNEVNDFAAAQERQKRERYELLSESAKKPIHHTHIPAGADPDSAVPVLENRTLMFELQVRYQTRMIGKRNVHVMKAGSKLSLGGGNSSFLVFLVKFPHRIADVRFDGRNCSLAILKPDYFPYETENVIEDCVGREFTIVSDRDYEVRFTLKEYEDPVVKLNRLLTSLRI